ncbi:Ig-like domain-containing protein [Meloidogyne graminicola]|uniref:Ig-like domain-containing protein n=1 Tax=Meloidogyne graminicola TaxID=189291 RepID=A0A8S9ZLG5_9BILA|nr:Ig-like domain-containing protein [Meloidogyne graminicola]
MYFSNKILFFLIFLINLINSQQQTERSTTKQQQKIEPKIKGSTGVTILVKNGLVKHQGLLETETPLTLWCQAVGMFNRKSPQKVLPAEEIFRPVVLTNTRVRIYEIPNQKFQFEGSGRTIIRGEDVNLTCPVFANPKPQIIWYKGVQEITKDERIKIDNEGNLIIQNVTYLDEGIYTCKAINTIIDKSTNINKKVQSNVSIERHLKVKSLFFK